MNRNTLIKTIDFIILGLLLASPAVSQNVQAPQQSGQPFTLKTTTEVVLVNVTVKDGKGNFVRDLKADDFTLTEDGKPQKILSLDVENTDALAVSNELQTANLLGDLNGATSTQIQAQAKGKARVPSPPVEYTKDTFRDRRIMVLFFDLSSMQPEEVLRAVESAAKFVDEQMKPADLVSLVSLSTRLNIDQDFTSNKDDLKGALRLLNPNEAVAAGATPDANADTSDSTATDDTFTADETESNIFNVDRKLDALRTIFETLQPIEQKKSLMFFSGGLQVTGIDNQASLRAATNAATRSNTSIYTIDARGLQAVIPGGSAAQASSRGAGLFNGSGIRGQFQTLFQSTETLVTLASDTGGKAFTDTNDFAPAFAKVQEDTSMYYVLGYTSVNTVKDGHYRNIKVTVKTKDVRVDARKGYYADTDFAHMAKETRDKQMQDELAADLPSTDLPVYLSTGYFRLEDTKYFVPVSIVIPGTAIPFTQQSDQDRATLDILGAVLDPGPAAIRGALEGILGERGLEQLTALARDRGFDPGRQQQGPRIMSQIKDTIKLAVNANQEVKRKNVQYDAGFLLPPGRFRLRFIIRENQTGQIGSFETDVLIPNLQQAQVKVSSVVASAQKQAGKQKKDNPLTRNGTEIIPSVTHVFSRDQHLYLYYEVYDPTHPAGVDDKDKSAARLLTAARFYKGSTKVYETPLMEVNQINTPDRRAAAIELDVPLSELKPGFYTCQVNVIDNASGQFVFPRLALLVR
jgi:VWFA-related protein